MKVKVDLDTRISRTRKSQVNLIGVETSLDFTIFMKHSVLELRKKAKEVLGCQESFDVFLKKFLEQSRKFEKFPYQGYMSGMRISFGQQQNYGYGF